MNDSLHLQDRKLETLYHLFDTVNITQAIIFCNSRKKVEKLALNMLKNKFTVSVLVGLIDFNFD